MSGTSVTAAAASKIIIAVDFEGKIIRRWPDSVETTEWVPSTIEYDDEDPTSYKWGYQLQDDERKHEWFKLGLNPALQLSGLAQKYPSRTAWPMVQGAECERLVTDYLKGLKGHAEQYVRDKWGPEIVPKNRKPQYIITVPAVWSEKAQATTRKCAEGAGMGNKNNIQIITEPEAAGIYALKNMKLSLKVDDTFVLCDAGGGTVDLISYTVAELGKIPLIFEAAPGSGGLCGSTFLNRIFDDYLTQRFAGYRGWDSGYHQDAMHRFETKIKREFNGDLRKSFTVPARGLPANPSLDIANGQVEITGRRLQKIFEPVILEVLALVNAQIKATRPKVVTAVLLAGGFGRSEYLKKKIQEEVGDTRVISIEDGDTAIVRGALIRGLAERIPKLATVRIGARKARKHYGTLAYNIFDPEKHDENRKEDDEFSGGHRGSPVEESKPAKFGFYWDQRVASGRPSFIEMTLYACDDSENEGAPLYADSRAIAEVKKLMELKADVRSIPIAEFDQLPGEQGEMYYKLDFEIDMDLQLFYPAHTVQLEKT
ncbi:uncharacterized protein PAC_05501 [Phialocephala subalpina]|uniref:Hsp70 protein n=1 Tax=Phialocephala subalpina TaxID=576137 RepID=A0A1L7WS80_9HELO|nr:uncharacterized protein PAC_05501 [Phialocephala subalpina]